MIELIIALLIGIGAGIFTGLIPGIHINLIAAFTVAALPKLLEITQARTLAVFIVAMSITHTFIDFIPSVYLGAPEEETALSVLPGHVLLSEGKGHDAIVLTLIGSCAALVVIGVGTPLFILLIPTIYDATRAIVPFCLLGGTMYLIAREKNPLLASILFVLVGILGYATLSLPIKQPLLPLLSGLFGISGLVISIRQQPSIPSQIIKRVREILPSKKELCVATGAASSTAPLCAFLPGFGAGHAAVLAAEVGSESPTKFLVLVGAINTIVMGLSFATLFAIDRTRTGSAAAVQSILPELLVSDLTLLVITMIVAGCIATYGAITISKVAAKHITKVPYQKLSFTIIIVLILMTLLLSNWIGIIVLITSSAAGIFTIVAGVRRITMMGALILPTLLYFLL